MKPVTKWVVKYDGHHIGWSDKEKKHVYVDLHIGYDEDGLKIVEVFDNFLQFFGRKPSFEYFSHESAMKAARKIGSGHGPEEILFSVGNDALQRNSGAASSIAGAYFSPTPYVGSDGSSSSSSSSCSDSGSSSGGCDGGGGG